MGDSAMHIVGESELLVRAMGRWPSFHDATVVDAQLEHDRCRVMIHVFRMTDRVDDRGYYVLTDHHLVRFQMLGVSECSLPAGYDRDTLSELDIERSGGGVSVTFHSVIDPEFSWQVLCREVSLTEVVPCSAQGEPAS